MKNDKDRYWDCLDQAMEASHGGRTEEALAWLEEALKARITWLACDLCDKWRRVGLAKSSAVPERWACAGIDS